MAQTGQHFVANRASMPGLGICAIEHTASHVVVGKLLKQQDYRLQGNVKGLEGNQSPDRNAQFEHINASGAAALQANQPVISVATKK